MTPSDDPGEWGERVWRSHAFHPEVDVREDQVLGVLHLPDGTAHVVREERVIGFVRGSA